MKFAFIFGTNIFLSTENTVSYADADTRIPFLKILSYRKLNNNNNSDNHLVIDLNIATSSDEAIVWHGDQFEGNSPVQINTGDDSVRLFRDGHEEPVFFIRQLTDDDISGLSSHIVNEVEAQQPLGVFKIQGDFRVGGHRIIIDNEKLFVNGDDFANGVTNSKQDASLTPYGVLS